MSLAPDKPGRCCGAILRYDNVIKTALAFRNESNLNVRNSVPQNTNVRFSSSLDRGLDLSRRTSRQTLAMVDLGSSAQQRGRMFEKSRIALSPHGRARQNREARDTRSLLSQSLSDVRPQVQSSWVGGDQFSSNRGYGIAGSSSVTSAGQRLFSSRSPSLFFHGRSLRGFDASQSSGFLQSLSSSRSDTFFLPSVGILGGVSQTRAGGAFGGSTLGSYSGLSGLHSGFGFQRLMTGPTRFDGRLYNSASVGNLQQQVSSQVQGSSLNSARQGAAFGSDGRLYNSSSLGNLQQQFSQDVRETSLNAAPQQAFVEVPSNSEGSRLNVNASSGGSHQAATSQQTEVVENGDASYAGGMSDFSQPQSVVIRELDLTDSVSSQSKGTIMPQNVGGQAMVEGEQVSTSLQITDPGSLGNDAELTMQAQDQVVGNFPQEIGFQ